uniref:Uncharacterized protein n=1 Tax=Ignisphaera aggregans TaxID=334771 RepID=A0A7J2TB24_9CREN
MAVKLRSPPRIKVLEALGCIADGRIKILGDNFARVISSDGSREYRVYVDLQKGIVYSDDNGTKFRGYVGYPIIALLMIKGVLPYDETLARALAGIPWKKLNEEYKSYATVENIVKNLVKQRGVDPKTLDSFTNNIMIQLLRLALIYDPSIEKSSHGFAES